MLFLRHSVYACFITPPLQSNIELCTAFENDFKTLETRFVGKETLVGV